MPIEEQVFQHCLDVASRYLSYRPRSEAELRHRLLQRGFDNGSIEKVIFRLKEQGLVDDTAFARFWKENRDSFSPRSRLLLGRELRQKGVNPDIIAEIVEAVDEETNAYKAAQKKASALAGLDYWTFRRRLSSFLRRRGFSYEVTQHTVSQLWQERT